MFSFLLVSQISQIFSFIFHQCTGRFPCLWDGTQAQFLLPAALWPRTLCQKLSYISESSDLFCCSFYILITGIVLLLWGAPSCSSVILKFTSEDTLQHSFSPVSHHSCFSLPWLKIMGLVMVKGFLWVLKSMKIIGFSGSTRSVSFWNRVVWEGAVRAGDAAAGRGGSAQWDVITHLEGWCLVLCLPLLSWAAEPGAALVEDF